MKQKDEDELVLDSIYELLKMTKQKVREGFSTDNTRKPIWGPNAFANPKRQQAEHTQYVKNTTANKRDNYITQFAALNKSMEGDRGAFYNPGKGTSGWTVGQGIDIGQVSRDKAISLGMPMKLVEAADKYKAWGREGMKVPREVQKMKMDMESEEWQDFGRKVAEEQLPIMEKIATDNPQLSTRGVVTLAQANHWAGSIYSRGKQASKFNRSKLSLSTDGKRTSATKDLINPMANLLESGGATDEGVREVLSLVQKSYGTKRPLNSTTINRYINHLDTGNYS